mmetsp:Transcript_38653/g.57476  ORF Transcript_38653/g.57476 Transcript_38653/m.57476 type:complete len:440 (-) Transcript_38653:36-1355(-)|eukprot:CAMPEP_0194031084 /NCGR_PEP_ID=MMETSP0009_2-20130614/4351_1 /TAXON_ID=210454 /ORGANISM="Grammatophora oceanica, Strain CCMP 410" /LENGTH=439 /DNA_ID=CAMNT_0038671153 /DNA_START=104 /DNA_END=1423 /DNA_ORIENTATION=+
MTTYTATRTSLWCILWIVIVVVVSSSATSPLAGKEGYQDETTIKLFSPSPIIHAIGPTSFPKPTDMIWDNDDTEDDEPIPVVEPIFGKHRPDHDAIFAYAEGYTVEWYLSFLESLKETGFDGDVVLAIAEERIRAKGVLEYLQQQSDFVVVYSIQMDCFESDRVTLGGRSMKGGGLDIFQMCLLNHVYGWKKEDGTVRKTALDPREGRVVATLRYEWYWIWAQHYHNDRWIMVLDARDSFFQSNPFANLPRHEDERSATSGKLWFFGENTEATRLGKSTKNKKWLANGYGQEVLDAVQDKPTICSGSTMGERVAMEQYLRALVQEKEETTVRMTGSDQGFHNYLYYSSKLANVLAIDSLTVYGQGNGIINNMGALRTKPFVEWGIYDEETHEVFNWDRETLSPVVHQWDRDKHLHGYRVGPKFSELKQKWKEEKEKLGL